MRKQSFCLPGKNLLGQVLDNANRSNSNSNNDASNGRGGRGGESNGSWGGLENFDEQNIEFSRLEFSETTQAAFADGANASGRGSRSGCAPDGSLPSSILNSPGLVMTPGGSLGRRETLSDEMANDAVNGLRSLSTPKKKGKRSLFDKFATFFSFGRQKCQGKFSEIL